jgi:hypothetical protein
MNENFTPASARWKDADKKAWLLSPRSRAKQASIDLFRNAAIAAFAISPRLQDMDPSGSSGNREKDERMKKVCVCVCDDDNNNNINTNTHHYYYYHYRSL